MADESTSTTSTSTKASAKSNDAPEPAEGADTRDTNKPVGAVGEAREAAEKAAKEQKVVRRFPDGSSEWTTAGELEADHGDPRGFPNTADLNPAYAPGASTHAGAAE